jgi:L-threonylcarbamoyladenylate synthase
MTDDSWQRCQQVLKEGGVVIIPSESSYGIAALIENKEAIRKLYQIKKRSDKKPSLMIVGSIEQAQSLVKFTPKALVLASKYWPGGLTMVLDSVNKDLPQLIYGEGKSLAVRIPGFKQLRQLALEAGPFVLPSANITDEKPPYSLEEIDQQLASQVDSILKESTGGNEVSTLVDARDEEVKILRQGAVKI